ncbi:NAD-dependent succinate-semialdehyde dehydrogenase [Corynebacterium heidelbergense]|uniref:NAD-dependent succinate-semialdehyde dehydrogenase n=1 Tax=Corynebacterium heidelbergense TaxID=2055947 RepID=A0A364V3K3_9CORY|nr:NAD-dependent succinate-semialdehyde dehydrogenase [Corynebacterium heidelbergense]RAV31225.1 NAD-dependent succinate-semialdehyde dehydrogenase [Corynebacterium heidelbergense]
MTDHASTTPTGGPTHGDTAPTVTVRAGERSITVPTGLFINGSFRPGGDGETISVVDASTARPFADVASATEADATEALDHAVAVQQDWAATPTRERAEIMRRIFDLLMENAEDLAALQSLELGRALPDSKGEVAYGSEYFRWFSERACAVRGDYRAAPAGNGRIVTHHRPVGPVLAITPWNFPLAMVTRKLAPALAAGCTLIAKPAQLTPLTMLFVAELCRRAGLPDGVFQVLPTSSAKRVSTLLEDDRLRKLTFTGSTEVGLKLASTAAQRAIRTSLELGGNAPFVVLSHADVDRAVEAAIASKMRGGGQVCIASNRFIVHRDVAEAFTRGVVERMGQFVLGPGTHPKTTLGPMVSADQLEKVAGLVERAVAEGATVELGGYRLTEEKLAQMKSSGAGAEEGSTVGDGGPGEQLPAAAGDAGAPGTNTPLRTATDLDPAGYWYPPTVLSGVSSTSEIANEEIFGPVLAIQTVDSDEEALRIANDTPFGLAAYVMGEKLEATIKFAEQLDAGMVGVNRGVISDASAPFGGVKQSGLGREGGFEGIEEYLETVYLALDV